MQAGDNGELEEPGDERGAQRVTASPWLIHRSGVPNRPGGYVSARAMAATDPAVLEAIIRRLQAARRLAAEAEPRYMTDFDLPGAGGY